jgi:Ras-related protein Rab-7A
MGSVGKTSLMNRYSTGKFTGQYKATIGADFLTKETVVGDAYGRNHLATLQIWDTAGQERFQSLGVGFYRGADACVLVYDITDPASLDNLNRWKTEFLEQVGGHAAGMGGDAGSAGVQFPFVVVGNKVDKERDRLVPAHRAEEWCREAGSGGGGGGIGGGGYGGYGVGGPIGAVGSLPLPHYEASAKTATNVDEAFHEVARLALSYEEHRRRSQPQLFVPPPTRPIDLRRQRSSFSDDGQESCC